MGFVSKVIRNASANANAEWRRRIENEMAVRDAGKRQADYLRQQAARIEKQSQPNGYIYIPTVKVPTRARDPPQIYLDNKYVGSVPIRLLAEPGTHRLTVKLKGYPDQYRVVNVAPGVVTNVTDVKFT